MFKNLLSKTAQEASPMIKTLINHGKTKKDNLKKALKYFDPKTTFKDPHLDAHHKNVMIHAGLIALGSTIFYTVNSKNS